MSRDTPLNPKSNTPIYLQIAELFISKIESGILTPNSIIPSVRDLMKSYTVSKDTIEKAYSELKKKGYIYAAAGKGYFVSPINTSDKLKVLCVLNNFSLFKQKIYYSFVNSLGDNACVDFQVHNYNPNTLKSIIEPNIWQYNYIVIMPIFENGTDPESYLTVLKSIPTNKLILLDKFIPDINCNKAVYQDFHADIVGALTKAKPYISKYKNKVAFLPRNKHELSEIIGKGIEQYGIENNQKIVLSYDILNELITKNTFYIVLSDEDLVVLLIKARELNLKVGVDIGIISYNESELKDLLDITVVSTDFQLMGETAAELIKENRNEIIKNPFRIIKRGSI